MTYIYIYIYVYIHTNIHAHNVCVLLPESRNIHALSYHAREQNLDPHILSSESFRRALRSSGEKTREFKKKTTRVCGLVFRVRGTLGDVDPLNKVPFKRAKHIGSRRVRSKGSP